MFVFFLFAVDWVVWVFNLGFNTWGFADASAYIVHELDASKRILVAGPELSNEF